MHIKLYLSNIFSKLNKIKLNYTYIVIKKSVGTRSCGGSKRRERAVCQGMYDYAQEFRLRLTPAAMIVEK